MSLTAYLLLAIFLTGAEWFYIELARASGWFDKPNERSSHENTTIVRAGGLVIYLAVVGAGWLGKLDLPLFGFGLTIINLISFWDDFSPVPKRYRLAVHLLSVGLLLVQERVFFSQWYVVIGLLFLGIGIVNAYNFMDGINGMTALYSLVTIGTFWYWKDLLPGGADSLFPSVFIALLIFSYVNVRRQAICFAGDVGSISIGFIVVYGLLGILHRTHTYLPVLCLAVYGVDSLGTLCQRLYRRENIFQAHRMHLFQLLVHVAGWPHLHVAVLYAVVQAGINVLVILALGWSAISQLGLAGSIFGVLILGYVWARHQMDRAEQNTGLDKRASSPSTRSATPVG